MSWIDKVRLWINENFHSLAGVVFTILFMLLMFSGIQNQNRSVRIRALEEHVESLVDQVDFVFVSRAVAFYHKKHPRATAEDLKTVEFLAKVLVQIAAEGQYKDKKHKVNPNIIFGLLLAESNAKPLAKGPYAIYGKLPAIGAYQISPINVAEVGKDCPNVESHFDLWDVWNNTCSALSIYSRYLQRHGNEQAAVLYYSSYIRAENDDPERIAYLNKVFEFNRQSAQHGV